MVNINVSKNPIAARNSQMSHGKDSTFGRGHYYGKNEDDLLVRDDETERI